MTDKTREGWPRAAAEEPRALFVPPEVGVELPASSLPALTAVKCAERQGREAFARLHDRLFPPTFAITSTSAGRTCSGVSPARAGLDMARFQQDYAAGEAYQAALHDYAEGTAWFGVSAVPTVIFNEKVSLVGAVPAERYRAMIDWILAGEPGGLVPLEPVDASQAGATRSGSA